MEYYTTTAGGAPPEWTDSVIEKMADELLLWLKKPDNVWFKDFCLDQDINPHYMTVWAKRNTKFHAAYELAKHKQESKIYNGALRNRYNSKIAAFGLMNNHGWAEKSKTEISGNANNPLNVLFNHSKELVNSNTQDDFTKNE